MGDNPRSHTIGPYQVEGRLGAGGMGEVYRAYDERLDRQVAVKLIRREAAEDERARERFRREARTAASLSHPAIVQIHDLVATAEGDALVMEYVAGVTLARHLAGGPLPLDRVLCLGQEIAGGLAAAHARGIVHRDLKAENVMVTEAGHAKILDFGVAKRLRRPEDEMSISVAGAVVGTYSSMSPEQARGLAVDHRSDLFSFGALLYEMATGRPPFLAATVLDTLSNVCAARQLPASIARPELPAPLSALIDRLLEKDPARRPQSADETAAALARLAAAAGGHLPFAAATLGTLALGTAGPAGDDGLPTVVGGRAPVLAGGGRRREDGRDAAPAPDPSGAGFDWGHDLDHGRDRRQHRRRRRKLVAGLAAALLAAAVLAVWLRRPAPLLTVAVPKPALGAGTAAGPDTDLMAAGLRDSLLETLLALDGVSPLAAEQVDPVAGTPLALARSVAADEVVTARLDCDPAACRVGLSRVAGKDGRLLWTESFEAPTGDPYLLAGEVASHLRHGYAARRARPGAAGLDVRPADYKEFLRLRGESIAQSRPPGELLPASRRSRRARRASSRASSSRRACAACASPSGATPTTWRAPSPPWRGRAGSPPPTPGRGSPWSTWRWPAASSTAPRGRSPSSSGCSRATRRRWCSAPACWRGAATPATLSPSCAGRWRGGRRGAISTTWRSWSTGWARATPRGATCASCCAARPASTRARRSSPRSSCSPATRRPRRRSTPAWWRGRRTSPSSATSGSPTCCCAATRRPRRASGRPATSSPPTRSTS